MIKVNLFRNILSKPISSRRKFFTTIYTPQSGEIKIRKYKISKKNHLSPWCREMKIKNRKNFNKPRSKARVRMATNKSYTWGVKSHRPTASSVWQIFKWEITKSHHLIIVVVSNIPQSSLLTFLVLTSLQNNENWKLQQSSISYEKSRKCWTRKHLIVGQQRLPTCLHISDDSYKSHRKRRNRLTTTSTHDVTYSMKSAPTLPVFIILSYTAVANNVETFTRIASCVCVNHSRVFLLCVRISGFLLNAQVSVFFCRSLKMACDWDRAEIYWIEEIT